MLVTVSALLQENTAEANRMPVHLGGLSRRGGTVAAGQPHSKMRFPTAVHNAV